MHTFYLKKFICIGTLCLFSVLFTACKIEINEGGLINYQTICTDYLDLIVNRDMASGAVYSNATGNCVQVEQPDSERISEVYADAACTQPIAFAQTNFESACYDLISSASSEVGDSSKWGSIKNSDEETKWFFSQWSRLKIYGYPQYNLKRPLVKEVVYASPQTGTNSSECDLVARIYKNSVHEPTKSAILFHGGGWEKRGLLAEVQNDLIATIYTNAGYTVFAPYYRLTRQTSSTSGINACYNATAQEIFEDIETFYTWFTNHTTFYNTQDKNLLVQGNSAGAHLAARLAADHSDDIDHAVLFYGPMDMNFILQQYRDENAGIYRSDSGQGVDFISLFFGVSDLKQEPNITSDFVTKSTFTNGSFTKSVYLIQGSGDTLVKPESAVRMCESLGGLTLSTGTYTYNESDADRSCNAASNPNTRLFMIKNAPHVMDIYVPCYNDKYRALNDNLLSDLGLNSCNASKSGFAPSVEAAYNHILASIQ